MRISEALRAAAESLAAASDTARLDAEVLMAHALGKTRSELLLRHMEAPVPAGFADMLARRMEGEPVAYITGRQEFFGREFLVNSDVLIPRSDSESVIEAALSGAQLIQSVLDCGVGSGALLLTLLAEHPEATGVGIDRSLGALSVASLNAARLGLADRCRMLARDWNEPGWSDGLGQFDLVIANPPYVEEDAELSPSVRRFEPAGALFAGQDGFDDYRSLIPQIPALLTKNGFAVLEIGASQAEAVSEIAATCGFSAELHNDLALRPRALVLRFRLGKNDSPG